LLAIKFR